MVKKVVTIFCLILIAPVLFADKKASDPAPELLFSPTLCGGLLLPIGAFTTIAPVGGGMEAGLEMGNILFQNSALKLIVGYNFIGQNISSVSSFGLSSLALLAGYTIDLFESVSLTPLAGCGYIGHFVTEASLLTFFDPLIRLEADLNFALAPDFHLFIAPAFSLFFEQSNTGMFLCLNMGASYSFHVPITNVAAGTESPGASEPFTPDAAPIAATLTVNPKIISPTEDGANDTVTIGLSSTEESRIASWSIRILDPAGNLFREKKPGGERPLKMVWDGRSDSGELVQSAAEYTIEARLSDDAGNVTLLKDKIASDILIIKIGNRLKVVIPSIVFEGYSVDFRAGAPEQVAKNIQVLDRLAGLFKKYPGYTLVIEGYAINIYTDSPERMEQENREALLPLSQKRAEAIFFAMIERGLEEARIKAVGRGNADPVVPYSDKANQWKNRRVEFILEK